MPSLLECGILKPKPLLIAAKNGGFKSVDDIGKVDGVGPVTLEKVR